MIAPGTAGESRVARRRTPPDRAVRRRSPAADRARSASSCAATPPAAAGSGRSARAAPRRPSGTGRRSPRPSALGDRPHDERLSAPGVPGHEHAGDVGRVLASRATFPRASSSTPSCVDQAVVLLGPGEAHREQHQLRPAAPAPCRHRLEPAVPELDLDQPQARTLPSSSPGTPGVDRVDPVAALLVGALEIRKIIGYVGHGCAARAGIRWRLRHDLQLRHRHARPAGAPYPGSRRRCRRRR